MSAWPRQPTDADTLFARSLERIFAEYPPSVTKAVTDPLTGMQRNPAYEKFPPTVPQIVKELNREMEIFRLKSIKHQIKRVDAEREREGIPRPPLNLEKYPDFFGPKAEEKRRSAFRPLSEIAKEAGVTAEQIKAMPNRPPGDTPLDSLEASLSALDDFGKEMTG